MNVDRLITGGYIYSTVQKTFKQQDIAILGTQIYAVGPDLATSVTATTREDARECFIIPGFIDSHMHIESSMTTPARFAQAVLPFGTTTVIADAHEIANVAGIEGLRHFFSATTSLDIFQAIPSSVPSTRPDLETTGGTIGLTEVRELLANPNVICLGEAMNFQGIAYEPQSLIRKIIELCQSERPSMPLEGHIPKIYGTALADFLMSGISSDHTHQFPEHICEKIEAGLFLQFQEKSITPATMAVLKEQQLVEFAALVTDDVMADDLLKGHLDQLVRLAIQCGLSPEEAIYLATYTPARRMGLHDRGQLAPGKKADLIVLRNLEKVTIQDVMKNGAWVSATKAEPELETFPKHFYRSVNCRDLEPEDLELSYKGAAHQVEVHVIHQEKIGTFTSCQKQRVPVVNGQVALQEAGIAQIVVCERYGKNGNLGRGLIEDRFNQPAAIATTWAHDHHNLMVMGNDSAAMIQAQKAVKDLQGGYVVVRGTEILASCPLPIGGILSQAPTAELAAQLAAVRQAMRTIGYEHANEIMSFSTLSLPVSPAVKMTDFGMMDTLTQTFYPLFVDAEEVEV